MENNNLQRFVDAQEETYEHALREIRKGYKLGHWIWYIFPQLKGLGYSWLSDYYGIACLNEAAAYLAHPVLGPRLHEITEALLTHEDKSVEQIFTQIDAMKVRSSMTLFDAVSPNDVFGRVLDKFYESSSDELTLRRLGLISEIEKNVKSRNKGIIGAIIGDIVGSQSVFYKRVTSTEFSLFTDHNKFTDNSVMTVAVADWLLGQDLVKSMEAWGCRRRNRGYREYPS